MGQSPHKIFNLPLKVITERRLTFKHKMHIDTTISYTQKQRKHFDRKWCVPALSCLKPTINAV